MNKTGTRVAKNASVLMISQLVTWGLTLLLTIFQPRYLGVNISGQLVVANSLWTIMAMFMNFGMDTLLTKEVARHPEKTTELLGTSLVLRIILSVLCSLVVALYLYITQASQLTINIYILTGLSTFIWTFIGAGLSALQGLETMEYMSIANIAGKAINTIFGIAVLVIGWGVYAFGIVNSIAAIVTLWLLIIFIQRSYTVKLSFQVAQAWAMLRHSAPYLLSGLGLILYGQIDVLIISRLVNESEAGWYGVASRLSGTFVFIPVIFTTAIFPVLTRTYVQAASSLPLVMRKSFDLMLLCSIPIGLGIFAVADPLVLLLYGNEFAQSGPILAVMGIVAIFTYQNILIGQFLISTDRQNIWTIVMIIATVVTVPLDLFLIPWCEQAFGIGAIGGALSFVVTEFAMVVVGIILLPRGSLGWSNVRSTGLILLAGVAMAVVAWLCRDMFIAIPILVGGIVYITMILLLRVLSTEDIALLRSMIENIINRVQQRKEKSVGITGA